MARCLTIGRMQPTEFARIWPEPVDITGAIGALWIFPVKSCAGIQVGAARLLPTGLEWDRAWMIVDAHGRFLTQREAPQMAHILPHIDTASDQLHLAYRLHPGGPRLSVPLALPWLSVQPQLRVRVWKSEVLAWDLGDAAAQWCTQALGQPCRLVRYDPAQQRLSNPRWTGGLQAPNQFADGYPLLVTTSAAFQDLNARLHQQGHAPVDGLRFRANIVLDGLAAHEEDYIDTLWVQAEQPVAIRLGKPCSRCPIPDIDPQTAARSPEVGQTLGAYRQDARLDGAITFGMNAVVAHGAGQWLRQGQAVGGRLKFD